MSSVNIVELINQLRNKYIECEQLASSRNTDELTQKINESIKIICKIKKAYMVQFIDKQHANVSQNESFNGEYDSYFNNYLK